MNIFCYTHNIADFRRDTGHLTHEQKGIYRDVLDAYYFSGGNMTCDLDQIARIISVQTPSERAGLEHIIGNYFTKKNGYLRQTRCDAEILKIAEKSRSAKVAADTRYLKTKETGTCERSTGNDANALPTMNHEPRTNKLASSGAHAKKINGSAENTVFDEKTVDKAKPGDPAWKPEQTDSEIIPGGWHDAGLENGVRDEQIYASWRKFKETTPAPFQLTRWLGWVRRERAN